MANVGDIRAFVDATGRAIYGQVIAERDGDVALIDTDGCFYWADKTYGLGHRLPDGTVLIENSKVAAEVHAITTELLNNPLAKGIRKRFVAMAPHLEKGEGVRLVTKIETDKAEPRTRYRAWDAVPLRMFTGRQLDDAGKPRMTHEMERYLFESDEQRNREATLLSILAESKPTEYESVMAVFYGEMTHKNAAEMLNLERSTVTKAYGRGMRWLAPRMGWNVSGTN